MVSRRDPSIAECCDKIKWRQSHYLRKQEGLRLSLEKIGVGYVI